MPGRQPTRFVSRGFRRYQGLSRSVRCRQSPVLVRSRPVPCRGGKVVPFDAQDESTPQSPGQPRAMVVWKHQHRLLVSQANWWCPRRDPRTHEAMDFAPPCFEIRQNITGTGSVGGTIESGTSSAGSGAPQVLLPHGNTVVPRAPGMRECPVTGGAPVRVAAGVGSSRASRGAGSESASCPLGNTFLQRFAPVRPVRTSFSLLTASDVSGSGGSLCG